MKARFMIESPDEIIATMKITMSLKEWALLRDQLFKHWPSSELSNHITELLSQGRKVFYPEGGNTTDKATGEGDA